MHAADGVGHGLCAQPPREFPRRQKITRSPVWIPIPSATRFHFHYSVALLFNMERDRVTLTSGASIGVRSRKQVPSPHHGSSRYHGTLRSGPPVLPFPRPAEKSQAPSKEVDCTPNIVSARHVYEPLRSSEFRIIKLGVPSNGNLSASMIKCDLRNPPNYVAMSYAWGDVGRTTTLLVDNRHISISESLRDALREMAVGNHPYARATMGLWVDALCIDQSNIEERNEQVRMMTSIYENAWFVALWLGPSQPMDLAARRFLVRLSMSPDRLDTLQNASKESLIAVATLFSRPYWSRLWVMQEIYNARIVHVYYGQSFRTHRLYSRADQANDCSANCCLQTRGESLSWVLQTTISACLKYWCTRAPRLLATY